MNLFKIAGIAIIIGLVTILFQAPPAYTDHKSWSYAGVEYQLPRPLE